MKIKNIVTEIGVFSVGIGILGGLAAALSAASIEPHAPPFFGVSRQLAIPLLVGIVAAANLVSGLIVLRTRSRPAIGLSITAAVLVFVAYVLLMGGMWASSFLLLGMAAVIPVAVLARGLKAIHEISLQKHHAA